MFSSIRNRLTIQYAAVMAVFLLTFIVVSYSGILWLLYREEQQDIRAFTEEEAREAVFMLQQKKAGVPLGDDATGSDAGNKLFFYLYDSQGLLVMHQPPVPEARPFIRNFIAQWSVPDGEGKIKRLTLENGEKAVFIMCSLPVYDGPSLLGRVYVGEDITSYYGMLKTMLIVLASVALLFLLAAAYLGHVLAGKAIVPISQAFTRQQEFAADASHELRTPLSILMTSIDAVQADDETKLTPFSSQLLADMKNEIKRMSRLVTNLLTLARADAGVMSLIKEQFDVAAVAEQTLRSFQPLADEKGVCLELDGQKPLPLFADRERIAQLLLILIDNAIKYTASGGSVKVSASPAPGKKASVILTVADTGAGISPEYADLIFERFYRVDKARSREEGGFGLGLPIARWIAAAHGGTIRLESAPGQGSVFTVTLPG